MYWEANSGYVNDSGDFVNYSDEEFGWSPDDYSHWCELEASPPPPKRKRVE